MKKLFFFLSLALCLLFCATPAMALTNEEILRRISNLEQEIATLKSMIILPQAESEKADSASVEEKQENVSCHKGVNGAWDYCSLDCPCLNGFGDCDNHLECQSGYCAYDKGAKYGLLFTIDICEQNPKQSSQKASAPAVPLVSTAIPLLSSVSLNENDYLTIKAKVSDKKTLEPIKTANVFLEHPVINFSQKLAQTNKNGVFEIKLNKRLALSKEIKVKAQGYFSSYFYYCEDCLGYQAAVILPDSLKEETNIVFPIFNSSLEISPILLERAGDLKVFSDRFVKVQVERQTAKGEFVLSGQTQGFSQTSEIPDILKEAVFSRVVLTDKQAVQYISPIYFQQEGAFLPADLSFVAGEFLWGVCGNQICEKEDLSCPSDCLNGCLESEEQAPNKCIFGCEGDACKKDILLAFPNKEQTFKGGDKIEIEWLQAGLESQTLDFELLAFDQQNELVKGFQYLIATSVEPTLGSFSFQLPNDLKSENKYKIVVYNKMCSESGETLVSCLKERYLSKSENYFALQAPAKPKVPSFAQAQLANISQATSLLLEKIQQLLK